VTFDGGVVPRRDVVVALARTVIREEEILASLPRTDAFDRIQEGLRATGKVQTSDASRSRLTGWIRSGSLKMNKASLSVTVQQVDAKRSRVLFSVSAQEGLVDQNTCGRALSRLLSAAALPAVEDDSAVCPWCAETIKAAALVCRFCGRDVS
jgi:hypothetical protein